MADLGTNVRYIKGIGEARAAALEKLGITTLGDLIAYFPRGYEDRTQVRPIRELTAGESVCVRGMVAADLTAYRISGGRTIAKTRVVDDSGAMDLVFSTPSIWAAPCAWGRRMCFSAGWRTICGASR